MSAAQSRHKRWISYDQSEQYELQAGKLELTNQLSAEKVARKAAEKHATHVQRMLVPVRAAHPHRLPLAVAASFFHLLLFDLVHLFHYF